MKYENKIKNIFARNMRALRKNKNVTQEQLSKLCGISQQHISAMENAEQNINLLTLAKIADALSVPPYLFLAE